MASMSTFIGKIGQGVKPNQFSVSIPYPAGIADVTAGDDELTNLLCKSAALPGSNLGVIEVPFRGRTIKIAGDRTFDTWSATFFNDKDMKTRAFFEAWLNSINSHDGNASSNPNLTGEAAGAQGIYSTTIKVNQLERGTEAENAQIIRTYDLKFAFPTSVSQIDLAYDSNDQIEEFTVEFQYSFWQVAKGGRCGASANPGLEN